MTNRDDPMTVQADHRHTQPVDTKGIDDDDDNDGILQTNDMESREELEI